MKIYKKTIILLLIIFFAGGMANAHPFYVSLCQVDYDQETQALQISVKIFANDLLVSLGIEGENDINLGEENENPETDKFIYQYLQKHLSFEVNQKAANYSYIGKEMDKDVVWSYLEIENVKSLENIAVQCDLLVDEFDGQSNIIQVNKKGVIKNLLLNKNKTDGTLNFTD